MAKTPLIVVMLLAWLFLGTTVDRVDPAVSGNVGGATVDMATNALYAEIGLDGELSENVFEAGYRRMQRQGVTSRMLAIADMTQPSDAKRLYIIDLEKKELVLRTYVAHGQGSGERMATAFSNREGSHQTSLGLYRVGAEIVSPKHGAALLLHGLEHGVNSLALEREVIIHGADYVSERFIAQHGRLGRSWGCPAVGRDEMPRVIDLLADGGLLYVHGKR